MALDDCSKERVGLVYASLPTAEEIDQFRLLDDRYDLTVIASESIIGFLAQNSAYDTMRCVALPDHDDNTAFLPGLEKVLEEFPLVIVKERLGVYAYQVVKAKWKSRFRLLVWVDNLCPLPGEDLLRMRTVRQELVQAADGFLVQTEAARLTLELEGIAPERIYKVLPWVERRVERSPKAKSSALAELGLPEEAFAIVYTGQLEWEEGLLDLLYAAKLLTGEDPAMARRLRLVISGFGSFASELKHRSLVLGMDTHLHFVTPSRQSRDKLLLAADCIFIGNQSSRDRLEGDPFRLISAMAHSIPVVAARSALVEETLGKHRFDYCAGSAKSLAAAFSKVAEARQLVHNVLGKNLATAAKLFSCEVNQASMAALLSQLLARNPLVDQSAIDHQVLEVETKVAAQQYIEAIDRIEVIFKNGELPAHHQSNLYRLIGDCFTKLGDGESGKNSYLQAIELDAFSAKAHIGLGTISLTKNNYDIAIIHFQKAVSLAPNDEMANFGLGLAFQGLDELGEANKWVMKALRLNPDNAAALYTIVRIAQEREEYADAEKGIRLYLHRHPNDHSMVYTLGGILFKMERHDEVLEAMQEILSTNPMDGRAQALVKQSKRAMDRASRPSAG